MRRLWGKCQRGSQSERQLSPHPGPLPRGEGESSTASQHAPARCLPDEPPEQPNLPPTVPSPRGRVRVRGIGLPLDTATQTSPEIAERSHLNYLLRDPRICCHDSSTHHTLCGFQPIYHRGLSGRVRSSLPSGG